jgi:acyl carrier protein
VTDTPFTIDRMYALMANVFMLGDFTFERWMSSADVPGWDSLHHVVLTMELERRTGVELSPDETARFPDIGSLYDHVRSRMGEGPES